MKQTDFAKHVSGAHRTRLFSCDATDTVNDFVGTKKTSTEMASKDTHTHTGKWTVLHPTGNEKQAQWLESILHSTGPKKTQCRETTATTDDRRALNFGWQTCIKFGCWFNEFQMCHWWGVTSYQTHRFTPIILMPFCGSSLFKQIIQNDGQTQATFSRPDQTMSSIGFLSSHRF